MLAYAVLTAVAVALDPSSPGTGAALPSDAELSRRFTGTVRPFLEQYCFACHGEEKQKGRLDLSAWSDVGAVLGDLRRFEAVRRKLEAAQMPPAEAERQPPPDLRREVLDWIRALRRREAE